MPKLIVFHLEQHALCKHAASKGYLYANATLYGNFICANEVYYQGDCWGLIIGLSAGTCWHTYNLNFTIVVMLMSCFSPIFDCKGNFNLCNIHESPWNFPPCWTRKGPQSHLPWEPGCGHNEQCQTSIIYTGTNLLCMQNNKLRYCLVQIPWPFAS